MGYSERFRVSVPASSTVEVSLGPLKVIPAGGGKLTLYANCPTDGAITTTLQLGGDTVIRRATLNVAQTAGRVQVPDDYVGDGIGVGGDAVTLELTNTTVGAVVAQGLLQLT